LIKEQQQQTDDILVLDAGDALVRDEPPATTSQGRTSVELMNMMGYDAMALGEGDLSILGVDAIRQRMQEADFAFLSANVVVTGTQELLAQPYLLREMGGHRIAVIGITGVALLPEVEILDPVLSVQRVLDELNGQADVVILLSHAGLGVNAQIAAAVSGLDLIVSGGGDGYTPAPQFGPNGMPIVHADASTPGHAGRRVGVGVWPFDARGDLEGQSWDTVALGPEIPDDQDMTAWVQANH
jgi:2',3'-cyclic-nucleotide 2'-phosphodiesterase (5'-nucleotidase family)